MKEKLTDKKSNNNKRTKKQHYIAQGIIKSFFETSSIYEKNIHTGKCYKTSISNTMCISNAYESSMFEDNYLEKTFATSIDIDSVNLINRLKELLDDNKPKEAKETIYKYIKIYLINYYKSLTSLIHMGINNIEKDKTSVIKMAQTIFNKPYMDRISKLLCTGYDFTFIKSYNNNFVLSDQFISTCSLKFIGNFLNISNREIGLKNTLILIPISVKYYGLFICGQLPNEFKLELEHINTLKEDQTMAINEIILNNSYEKCISLHEKDLKYLNRKNNSSGDTVTLTKFASGEHAGFKIKQEIFFSDEEYDLYHFFNNYEWGTIKYKKCGANDECPCGSNRKYKKCCKDKVEKCYRILNTMHYSNEDLLLDKKLGLENQIQLSNFDQDELRRKYSFLKK